MTVPRRGGGRGVLVGLALVALSGCGGGPATGTTADLLASVGAGWTVPPGGPDGPLGPDAAAAATPADPRVLRPLLSSADYRSAEERVFVRNAEFISLVVYRFGSTSAASAFEDAALRSIVATGTATVGAAGNAPGEQVFQFAGGTRANPETRFCTGVWFSALAAAVEVLDCAPDRFGTPGVVTDLAEQEFRLLGPAAAAPTG